MQIQNRDMNGNNDSPFYGQGFSGQDCIFQLRNAADLYQGIADGDQTGDKQPC